MLSGVRVLDLTRVLAGPLCTMMLGDLGADVIKVERPGLGDDTRGWGPPFHESGESAYFLSVNRNKKSLAADLAQPADRELIATLITEADVIVDNFRRGVLERYQLHPERFRGSHPRLIWCTITGFGADSDRPGYDYVVQAERGWMAITGEADGAPMKAGVALADVIAGKDAAIAILGALFARERTSLGCRIITSLAHSATAALVNVAQNALVTNVEPRRWGNAHPNLVPYQLFDTRDRPIVIAVGSDAQWLACARALELHTLADDPSLATNAGRLAERSRVVRAIADRLREGCAADWLAVLDRAGVPCGVVRGVLEALGDVPASALTGVAPSTPGSIRFPPPRLDEHGEEIRAKGWGAFPKTER
jgi:crotonobetainyl-CoA:carnitine CoA-transferase CaiB-like acyl-CoA transferase